MENWGDGGGKRDSFGKWITKATYLRGRNGQMRRRGKKKTIEISRVNEESNRGHLQSHLLLGDEERAKKIGARTNRTGRGG